MSKNYATEFKVIRMSLYKVGEETKPYVDLSGDMCKQFQYYEDIMWPSYAATMVIEDNAENIISTCLLYTSPSPRDVEESRMPSSA